LRAWVLARDHAAVQAELLEAILGDFSARGLRLPLPQREVHVYHHGVGNQAAEGVHELLKPSL
jgi:small conductance mechanosensitive channel